MATAVRSFFPPLKQTPIKLVRESLFFKRDEADFFVDLSGFLPTRREVELFRRDRTLRPSSFERPLAWLPEEL